MPRILILLFALSLATAPSAAATKTAQRPAAYKAEKLDRGFVAISKPDNTIYLSWRLLRDDPDDIAFNIYRKTIGSVNDNGFVRLNAEPITRTTDYLDQGGEYHGPVEPGKPAKINEGHIYKITKVVGGKESDLEGGETYVFHWRGGKNYRCIRLQDPDLGVSRVAVADLDGDGAMDFVVLRETKAYNVDPGTDPDCWTPSRDTFKLEAYTSTGKLLWRTDLGWGIETGIWYCPMIAYDIDGDGCAEVYCKTSEGDPREPDGHVLRGPEYLTKFDGRTGRVAARRPWLPRIPQCSWSYDWGNRNNMGVAYLDGRIPSLVLVRGIYGDIQIEALDKDLKTQWHFDTTGANAIYWGKGGHNFKAYDIDGDGRDELIPGSFALDDDGTPLWYLPGLQHSDHYVIDDIDPDRPGLEIFYNIETGSERNGVCLVDATTGEFVWGYDKPTNHVHASSVVGDYDPDCPGMECYAQADRRSDGRPFFYDCKGRRQTESPNLTDGKPIWWDADQSRELLHGGCVFKFHGDTLTRDIPVGYTADLLGDWREEVIVAAKGELRIYTTTIPASDRRPCLLQDRQYRTQVANNSSGYSSCPLPANAKAQAECRDKGKTKNWGDRVAAYMTEVYEPAATYLWDWDRATLLRAVADRYELGIGPEAALAYIRTAVDANMDKASGIHPNVLASCFGLAFLARVTGEAKYKNKALEMFAQYKRTPRTADGAVSHRTETVELWDDTVYMISLYLSEMYRLTGDEAYLRELCTQIRLHADKLEDPQTGLWYHGWRGSEGSYDDGCCQKGWADNAARRSHEFWGRGNGWIAMALANTIGLLPKSMSAERQLLVSKYQKMMSTLLPLQDSKTGHWRQLPVYKDEAANWIESSSTAMFAYAIAEGIRLGLLPRSEYMDAVQKAFTGFEVNSLKPLDNYYTTRNVCSGTCIGDKEYYLHRRVAEGAQFALGVAVMMHDKCAAVLAEAKR